MEAATPVVDLATVRAADEKRQRVAAIDELLAKSDRGVILGTVSNLIIIIDKDPVLAGLCGYNEFTCQSVLHAPPPSAIDGATPLPGPYPRPWGEADVALVQSYIQRVWTRHAPPETTQSAMTTVAATHRFHPVRDWVNGLRWDGVPRLNTWLAKAFGASDNAYTQDVGAKLLIASVRRVRDPGCKFDHMPVFEGLQGIGKSTVIKLLYSAAWFTDSIPAKMESADAALCLQGVWCVEFAEIEQIIRAEVEIIKAFLSRPVDRFRAPYGRNFLTYPRQCVMIGTTNDCDYLRDASGNRRFWPVQCKFADPEWVTANREQLWAEAAAREDSGEDHWLSDREVQVEAAQQQEIRLQDDPWEDKINAYLAVRSIVKVSEVLDEGMGIAVCHQGKKEQMRVASLLKRAGWLRELVREGEGGYKVVRRWKRGGLHG